MKHLVTFFSALIISISAFCSDSLTVFYRIRLDQDIDPSSQRLVTLGLEKAREANADYILLDLDTYGGAVHIYEDRQFDWSCYRGESEWRGNA